MPIAHTCSSCGLSLARVPAPLDPVYRLTIAVCPECGDASVRRSDGHRLYPRWVTQLHEGVQRLVGSTLVFALAVGCCIGAGALLSEPAHRAGLTPRDLLAQAAHLREQDGRYASWQDDQGQVAVIISLILSIAVGAYLTAALPHARRLTLLAVFALVAAAAILLPPGIERLADLAERSARGQLPSLQQHFATSLRLLGALPWVGLLGLPSIPLGRRVRQGIAASRRARWKRLLRRTRKRRRWT